MFKIQDSQKLKFNPQQQSMNYGDQDWQKFTSFINRLVEMIMKIHRNEEIDPKKFFTKEEYFECTTLVFSTVKDSIDDSETTNSLQMEFSDFITQNVPFNFFKLFSFLRTSKAWNTTTLHFWRS